MSLNIITKMKHTITIFGVQVPVSEKILYPKKTEVIISYINAMKEGKGEARKVLKKIS